MGQKNGSKGKPPKSKRMPVLKADVLSTTPGTHKSGALLPMIINKGEAISVIRSGKKFSSAIVKKKKKR